MKGKFWHPIIESLTAFAASEGPGCLVAGKLFQEVLMEKIKAGT